MNRGANYPESHIHSRASPKKLHGSMTGLFVAIRKGMIADHRKAQGGRFFYNLGVEIVAVKCHDGCERAASNACASRMPGIPPVLEII